MIDTNDKDQFIATATRAWGHKGEDYRHVSGEGATKPETHKYYVVPGITFRENSIDGEKMFAQGEGTHRAYMLYRLMRKDSEQLASALKRVRFLMRINASKGRIYEEITNALNGRE